ncbi:hypothetical protein F511_31297 [Dorcoceras hygrometricum]|uniref:Uncharacterized protein n=1 Tax=Dorcoceras hygrometricum TaxID=472368 RepID=A0A2Z7APC8_9LAMI|nr:hypothetical protein F511_31297 [Dorcoceras hygrometricum]
MFKSIESSGLRGFLGCYAVIYELDLENLFDYAFVRANVVISVVQGKFVEISEDQFAGVFELPSEGLTTVDELPKDLINMARKDFSVNGDLIKASCKKKEMKVEYRLLNDILAKTVTAKEGSFDAQAKGFAAQIYVLLQGAPDLTLGECKTFPPLKILTVKTVGTYVAKNKSVCTNAEEVSDEPVVEKVVKAAAKRRPAPIDEPVVKNKRTTCGRDDPTEKTLVIVPVVQEAVPISVVPAEIPSTQRHQESKRKWILQHDSDEEESEEEIAVVATEEKIKEEPVEEETAKVEEDKKDEETEKEASDKGKRDVEAIDSKDTEPLSKLKRLTRIELGHGIETKEVDWYKATLPKIDPTDKGKAPIVEEIMGNPAKETFALISADVEFLVQIREVVVEEVASFFYSFSLRSLSTLTSVSDLASKEELMLKWAVTDSLQTAVQRRLYTTAKYREMLIRKFLEARHKNFESGTPTSDIDLQVLDLLSEAHRILLIHLLEQLRQHRLKWTRPSSSKLFGGTDVQSGGKFLQLDGSSSSDSRIHFIDDIPQASQMLPTVVLPTDFTESVSQLHASIDQIKFEQVQTRECVEELKAALSQKITRLEMAFAQSSSHQVMVFRDEINDVFKEIQIQKAALLQELTAFRLETQEGLKLFMLNCLKSLPILIEGVIKKMGKRVVEVHGLKTEADLVVVEEAAVNLQEKEVDLIEEEEAGVRDLVDGFLEQIFLFQFLYKTFVLSRFDYSKDIEQFILVFF